jgi:hypothetical protein
MKVTTAATVIATGLAILANSAWAQDCSAPPYGATMNEYRAWKETFGTLLEPDDRFVRGICEAKLQGRPDTRAFLHQIGFQDEDIDATPTAKLWVEVLNTIRRRARSTPQ